jgi:hypothetical protein
MVYFEEIGGNFPLEAERITDSDLCFSQLGSRYFFSSGRSAIHALILITKAQGKKVALPYFTCHSVIEPFVKSGCQIVYYQVEKDLRINQEAIIQFCRIEQPFLFFFHDYFGLNEGEKWNIIFNDFKHSLIFVNDQTHSFFSSNQTLFSHFSLMSMRKWGGIPEGGFLHVVEGNKDVLNYDERSSKDLRLECYVKASLLKNAYLNGDDSVNKDDFRNLFYKSESFFDTEDGIYPINQFGLAAWNNLLKSDFKEKRISNYRLLQDGWMHDWRSWGLPLLPYSIGITPLYFPVLLRIERLKFQKYLVKHSVYVPIIWPKSQLINAAGDDTLYDSLICIPIDQRYGEGDMQRILSLLQQFDTELRNERG